jgi:hypothetical protein
MNGGKLARLLKLRRPELKIIMFSGSRGIPVEERVCVDALVDKIEGLNKLMTVLHGIMSAPAAATALAGKESRNNARRFPRFRVRIPFAAEVKRRGRWAKLEGSCLQLGEGGLGGEVEGQLEIGEVVRLRMTDFRLGHLLQPRAEVRYRHGNVYGFAFCGLGRLAQAKLRLLCSQVAPA